jgi:hypothetical protein
MALKLDVQIFKNIRIHRAQPGDAASVDQIKRRYQETVYENAMLAGHVEIAVGQIAIERAARNFDRSDFIIPRWLSVSLKAHAPDPLYRLGVARNGRDQFTDLQILDPTLAFRGPDLCALQKTMAPTAATTMTIRVVSPPCSGSGHRCQ